MSERESLLLKWGTIKGWDFKTEASVQAAKAYADAGDVSFGAMQQRDNDQQKAALCNLIDVLDGDIQNDWTGKMMTKEEAKEYVMGYRP